MLYFKVCPRCGGDVHLDRDVYGEYRKCLQCGYMVDIEARLEFRATPVHHARPSRSAKGDRGIRLRRSVRELTHKT